MNGLDFEVIIFGQAGLAIIVSFIVGWIKMTWSDAKKWLYMVSAIALSLIAGAVAFPVYSIDWSWLLWLGMSAMTLGFQLLEQNELWPKIKEVGMSLLGIAHKK